MLPGLDQRRLVARSASAEAQDGFLGAALGNLAGVQALGSSTASPQPGESRTKPGSRFPMSGRARAEASSGAGCLLEKAVDGLVAGSGERLASGRKHLRQGAC